MPAPKDLTGQRFGRLTVLGLDPEPYRSPGGKPTRRWRCRCECGTELVVLQNALTGKNGTRSCGCVRAEKSRAAAVDMSGQRFGRLTVLGQEELDRPRTNGQRMGWKCRCDCGNIITAARKDLLSGKLLSCGCLLSEASAARLADAVGQMDGTTLSAIRPERGANKNSKSGIKGVYWSARDGCWIAKITVRRRSITVGRYHDLSAAIKARRAAEEEYFKPLLDAHKTPTQE